MLFQKNFEFYLSAVLNVIQNKQGGSEVKTHWPGKQIPPPRSHEKNYQLIAFKQPKRTESYHMTTYLDIHPLFFYGKALFGPYRHVLERRGETLFDAALSLWEPYVASILKALDGMPAEMEVDLPLLVRLCITPQCLPR